MSGADEYETPFGNLRVDTEVVNDLLEHDIFKSMDLDDDENEHSFEMHAPYIYRLTENSTSGIPTIIPIMISHTDEKFMSKMADILSEYLKDESSTFVVSSDFCHWGSRFGYTKYTPTGTLKDLESIRIFSKISPAGLSISESIEHLDNLATTIASTGSSKKWDEYIKKSGNTICGHKPISILLRTLELVRKEQNLGEHWAKFSWIGYFQSSKVTSASDSSVSYASGYAVA